MQKTKLIYLLLVILGASFYAQAQFSGTGNGTVDQPYQITNATQLNEMRNFLGTSGNGKHFQLINDIDLSAYIATSGWEPIGGNPEESQAFEGFLHGGNFTIKNLWIDQSSNNFIGLFGYIVNGGIDHLTIELDPINGIAGSENVGIFAGAIENATIADCIAKGKINAMMYIGGLVGFIKENVTVENNTTNVTITSSEGYVGGLAGQTNSPIINSISSGTLITSGDNIGGLVGYANAVITSSSSSVNIVHAGDFFTGNFVGGLVGVAKFSITNCHASGSVTGTNVVGGLIGDSYAPTIGSHASGNVTANAYVGGLAGNSDSVTNSYATGNVFANQDLVGGLAGQSYGPIDQSYATGTVSGAKALGGLVGTAFGSISHSFASGNVTGTTPDIAPEGGFIDIGGLVGHTFNATTNCYATGNLSVPLNSMYIGGLIGFATGDVTNCYASGSIDGESYGTVGGLIGGAWANITNCVAVNPSITSSLSGNLTKVNRLVGFTEFDAVITSCYALDSMRINGIGGTVGTEDNYQGLNKTITQLQTELNYNNDLAWDFDSIWNIREGKGYPFFKFKDHLRSVISSSVNNEEQGSILPLGDIAFEDGSNKIYEITPAEGYEIESIVVDNITVETNSSYAFSNIIANHSIRANFKLIDLGIEDKNLSGLTVYPNPVRDILTIAFEQDISNVEVFNLVGQNIYTKNINDKTGQIDMTHFSSGTYFIKVYCNNKSKIFKVLR